MSINTSLLIASPTLQDILVDKTTGTVLSDGVVSLYQDNSRTTFKNWYYQTGSPGAYTYTTLPNPMTLSAAGTIVDVNGNDTIPLFYPYDEVTGASQPYYITVYNSTGTRQFIRQNFPFNPNATPAGVATPTLQNLIVNNGFWRNIGSLNTANLPNSFSLNGGTLNYATLAPSQHDGFTDQKDIQYIKDVNGATETVTFKTFVNGGSASFPDQIIPMDVTPEYYLNINCTGAGTETVRYVQIPIQLHVNNLSGLQNCSVAIDAMAVNGGANAVITVGLFQFLGTGVTSPAVKILQTINLSTAWNKYVVTFSFQTSQSLTLGKGGDDGWYLQIGFPAAQVFDINIAKPSLYLSSTVPTNNFENYDKSHAIFDSPRTAIVRTSMETITPFGWTPMNNGLIGLTNPSTLPNISRINADTWPLYNLIWSYAKTYDGGGINYIAQMYNSSGTPIAYGSSAYSDFSSNNLIILMQTLGKVILGSANISSMYGISSVAITSATSFTGATPGGSVTNGLLITVPSGFNSFLGMPIVFSGSSLPGNIVSYIVYYAAPLSATTFLVATTFANALTINSPSTTPSVLGFTSGGSGTITVTSGIAGSSEGEYEHLQYLNEMVNHTHDPGSPLTTFLGQTSGHTLSQPAGTGVAGAGTTGNVTGEGNQIPFNVTQPGIYMNLFIKL